MIETAIALITAHILADFVFQPSWMVQRKKQFGVLALHILIVIATTLIISGTWQPLPLIIIGVLHLVTDFAKQHWGKANLSSFAVDQLVHILTILGVALAFPTLFASGWWPLAFQSLGTPGITPQSYLQLLTLISGAIIATRVGSFFIGLFIQQLNYHPPEQDAGLAHGGFYIGLLERALIFVLVLIGQVGGIGFLIAAKSILRFEASQDRKTAEYVIIGTLISFTWALVFASLTNLILGQIGS